MAMIPKSIEQKTLDTLLRIEAMLAQQIADKTPSPKEPVVSVEALIKAKPGTITNTLPKQGNNKGNK